MAKGAHRSCVLTSPPRLVGQSAWHSDFPRFSPYVKALAYCMGVIDTVCKARGEFDAVFRATSNLIHNTFMHMIE